MSTFTDECRRESRVGALPAAWLVVACPEEWEDALPPPVAEEPPSFELAEAAVVVVVEKIDPGVK
jgi:hypothetical protein